MNKSLDIQSNDVIKLILQFCKENSLSNTLMTLQEETGISLNTVDNIDELKHDIINGRWDKVLLELSNLKISYDKLIEIFEHIIMEMLEKGEYELSKHLLRKTEVMNYCKLNQVERYLQLEHYLQRQSTSDHGGGRIGSDFKNNITTRRKEIAESLCKDGETIQQIEPSRLLALLGQALKWQQYQGIVKPGDDFDLFRGQTKSVAAMEQEEPITQLDRSIVFGEKNRPDCAKFTPDAQYLITSSIDGFIEVWNYNTGALANLDYQSNDEFMMHNTGIISMCFSKDGEYMASGSTDGHVKVWQIKSGKCLRRFEPAHSLAVTCLHFTNNATQLLTGSLDSTLKMFGLKSGKVLKIFRGHSASINDCQVNSSEDKMISCSSDATVKVWDLKSGECIQTLMPVAQTKIRDIPIKNIYYVDHQADQVLICNQSSTIVIMSIRKQHIIKQYTLDDQKLSFVCCTISPNKRYLYAVSDDNYMNCYEIETSQLLYRYDLCHKKEVIGISIHPNRNIMATYSLDANLQLWKA